MFIRLTTFLILTLFISGCSGLPFGHTTLPSIVLSNDVLETCAEKPAKEYNYRGDETQETIVMVENTGSTSDPSYRINPNYLTALLKNRARLTPFLDCSIQTLPSSDNTDKATQEKDNQRTQIYRGYVVLSMVAQYGAANLRVGPYPEHESDALALLMAIKEAATMLHQHEQALGGHTDESKTQDRVKYMDRQQRLDRIFKILDVAILAERPTARRAKEAVTGLISAVMVQNYKDAGKGLLGYAVKAMKKSLHMNLRGPATIQDAITNLEQISYTTNLHPVTPSNADSEWNKHWKNRSKIIQKACDRILAFTGQTASFECTMQ
uniref:Lipoprotein n=1 Tax=Magnetococcus massalia (strain MO-1) TaxID=451514 RepID=A0A1S7LK40_MAGMO|nr:Exported protein of unknown function [Candidatus Magnetococcus massalia]